MEQWPDPKASHYFISSILGGLPANQMASQQTQNPRWKTSMCIAFAKNGFCTKMAACQYAHGPQELRGATTMPQTNMMGQSSQGRFLRDFFEHI